MCFVRAQMLSECIQVSQRNADEETLVNAMVLMCGMLVNGNQSLDKTLGLQIDVPGAQVKKASRRASPEPWFALRA